MLFFNTVLFYPHYAASLTLQEGRVASMTVKKNATKTKEKKVHAQEKASGTSRKAAVEEVAPVMDSRSSKERRNGDRRRKDQPVAVEHRQMERRAKVSRRRQIDPTTCERDYSPEEVEFMSALDDYKRRSGRMFPTCSEILEVIKALGYEKQLQPAPFVLPFETTNQAVSTEQSAV
jgi:hypothetical protein